ncbi:mrp [Tritrichomonas foetus]|uniref:Mrp n=1 Tax=Tritrichomonas foetus TaxID=1144522 RepID=A0A1J4JBA8_9EUKA|nr:mrp [Tritrichomonas foetus]|eukprot:OHS96424.1 mrp [Tritrichomonas foetus]
MLSSSIRSFRRYFANPFMKKKPLPDVGRIILTISCKGGVGKSTVALNTAVALSELGNRVGILDADLYGPSIPTMTNTNDNTIQKVRDDAYLPVPAYGIETMSIGNGIPRDSALLWKGPLIGQMVESFLTKTMWSPLDYLIVDTPPGTGDVQLSLHSSVLIDGAILVTSPQDVVYADVVRNIDMLKKMNIPILGIIQNFDGFVCPCCKKVTRIFKGNSGAQLSKKFDIELLGSLPIDPTLAQAADEGFPAVLKSPDSAYSQTFRTVAMRLMMKAPRLTEEEEEAKYLSMNPKAKKGKVEEVSEPAKKEKSTVIKP